MPIGVDDFEKLMRSNYYYFERAVELAKVLICVLSKQKPEDIYQKIIPMILKVELKRGDSETVFSPYIRGIRCIYGTDILIQILTALETGFKGHFQRRFFMIRGFYVQQSLLL